MYQKFFNLHEPPFTITPDPRFLFLGRYHQEALAHLLYSIRGSSGFILLTGEVGAGKTTISRCLIQKIPDDVDIALIFNPRLTALELIASICDDLKLSYPETAGLKVLFDVLNRHLLSNYAKNRTTVLILDEAQNLSVDLLEQIRLLSNLETDQKKLLQIILIGQPELSDLLARPELRQFSQRITARYHIAPLSIAETRDFVRHRLAVAGCTRTIFGPVILWVIHHAAKGIPRLLNQICDRALLGAYTLERRRVSLRIALAAIKEVMSKPRRRHTYRPAILVLFWLLVTLPLLQNMEVSWHNYFGTLRADGAALLSLFSPVSGKPEVISPALQENSVAVLSPQPDKPVAILLPAPVTRQPLPSTEPTPDLFVTALKSTTADFPTADQPTPVPTTVVQVEQYVGGIREQPAYRAEAPKPNQLDIELAIMSEITDLPEVTDRLDLNPVNSNSDSAIHAQRRILPAGDNSL